MQKCVVCGGNLLDDMRIKGMDSLAGVEGVVMEYQVGWYCEICGLKYRNLPTTYWDEQKARESLETDTSELSMVIESLKRENVELITRFQRVVKSIRDAQREGTAIPSSCVLLEMLEGSLDGN